MRPSGGISGGYCAQGLAAQNLVKEQRILADPLDRLDEIIHEGNAVDRALPLDFGTGNSGGRRVSHPKGSNGGVQRRERQGTRPVFDGKCRIEAIQGQVFRLGLHDPRPFDHFGDHGRAPLLKGLPFDRMLLRHPSNEIESFGMPCAEGLICIKARCLSNG
jgi:hypothetical protein